MENLRQQIMYDLQEILESEYRCAIELVDPEGVVYSGLFGRTLFDVLTISEEGFSEVVRKPNVTIAIKSLTRIPQAGEHWGGRIQFDNGIVGDLTPDLF